ncbi:MAG TPA: hypothetical protein VF681_02240 [Abditibacteriaceae bacterium]|jgi:hypothetical protein
MKWPFVKLFLLCSPLLVIGATTFLTVSTPWMRDARFWLNARNDYSERRARREAGFGAVDCGNAMLFMNENPALRRVDGCAISNFRKNTAFRFRYDSMGYHGTARHYRTWNPHRGLSSFVYYPPSIVGSSPQIVELSKCNPAKVVAQQDSGVIDTIYHTTIGCH